MERINLVELYSPMLLIPFWFISYTIFRCRRHFSDGTDRTHHFSRNLTTKYICTFFMMIFCFIHVFDILPSSYSTSEKTVRMFFFSSLGFAWFLSFYLVIFETRRRLRMKWSGHRSFWPINMVIHLIFAILQILETVTDFNNHEIIPIEKIVTFLLAFGICCILAVYAVFRPNEFTLINNDPLLYSRNMNQNRRTTVGRRKTVPEQEAEKKLFTTSIKECKIKTENNKQVVYFHIIVTSGGRTHTVRRTYAEFDSLHKTLRLKFPVDEFPYLDFPSFPRFHQNSYNLDYRMKALNDYLQELCFPEFMAAVFLDFLEINGHERTECLEYHNKVVNEERHLSIGSNDESGSRHGSVVANYYQPKFVYADEADTVQVPNYHLHSFINVKILKWIEERDHIEYAVQWKIPRLTQEGTIQKRFNEFYEFHRKLKKSLAPAGLPKFPSKNYLQNFRSQDSHALEIRKRKLENYLGHVLNDTAFLCQDVLDFINCTVDLESIWKSRLQGISYILHSPITWEGEVDKESHFLLYSLNFSKLYKGRQLCEWNIKRRYKDFNRLNRFLTKRLESPTLGNYIRFQQKLNITKPRKNSIEIQVLPSLPGKSISPLSSPGEIEARRKGLEKYMEELIAMPISAESFAFREFIDDPEIKQNLYEY
ncbi:unnamed protein product [Blepharisma stoltei]|uniref:PX domain-containing protein n=1 Tax=Blepharisma stoltei TaxID=1481888 RepID=A0AAU9IUM0_9CILI|nr:unnamed protein product [Blepharisma stoltei]